MRFLIVLGYNLVCSGFLSLFSNLQDMLKYLFSLGALYVGIQFFRRHEGRGMRIAFVVTTIVLYFIMAVIYAIYLTVKAGQLSGSV